MANKELTETNKKCKKYWQPQYKR